jgi:murein L,D-transpeptidase YafK
VKARLAIGLSVAALATVATVALARSGNSRFTAIDRCLADSRAWDYRASRCVPLPAGPIDRIVVDKSDRTLATYREGRLVRILRVALGSGGLAPKVRQGDGRVPEGSYSITYHNADSRYHRSLRIGYPTDEQRASAQAAGNNPGGDIMIHGLPNGMNAIGSRHLVRDWTAGCIAVTNREMDWLFDSVPDGARIDINA